MEHKKDYVKANHRRVKGKNILLTCGKTGLVTSPQLVRIYCLTDLKVLARWPQAIVNHLYWSIFTCGGNGKELVEHFTSFQHPIVNRRVTRAGRRGGRPPLPYFENQKKVR